MKAIDLFAGAGGFSTGARMAGIDVVWAANLILSGEGYSITGLPDLPPYRPGTYLALSGVNLGVSAHCSKIGSMGTTFHRFKYLRPYFTTPPTEAAFSWRNA